MTATDPNAVAAESLTQAERKLLAAVVNGTTIDLRTGKPSSDDPARGKRWGRTRQVRAEMLAELLTGKRRPDGQPSRAIKLVGARITGTLDLEGETLICTLVLTDCYLDGYVNLYEANARTIRMPGCHLPGLIARQLKTTGDLDLIDATFTAHDIVTLRDAHIGGALHLNGAVMTNPGGQALKADNIVIDQGMTCDGFTVDGEIRLINAHIGGQLSMSGASLTNPGGIVMFGDGLAVDMGMFCADQLTGNGRIQHFTTEGELRLLHARIGGQLILNGARLTNPNGVAIRGDNLTTHSILCRNGFTAHGEISLINAHVSGQFSLTEATLANPGGTALRAGGIVVGESMFCKDGFTADGEINLAQARIGGHLEISNATLTNPDGRAICADGMTAHSMACRNGFVAKGEIRLVGVHIDAQLSMSGADLANPGGVAIFGDGLTVGQDIVCRDGFSASGEIRLIGAHVQTLSLIGAKLANPGGAVILADGLTIDQHMLCRDGFTANGEVDLRTARIGGGLDMTGATLANPGRIALNLDTANVAYLILRLQQPPDGAVNLSGARVGGLLDNPASWPTSLWLQAFTYDYLGPDTGSTRQRLDWLSRHQGGYVPQLYDQLASTYQRAGDERSARRVAITKQRRRRSAYSPLSWLWYLTVGYGYRPWLAGAWIIALAGIGTVLFSRARMIATSSHPPAFHALAYALDLLLPVIGLGEKSAWHPQQPAYQYWSWIFLGAGWVLTTALVAGLTGILKRD